MDKINDTTIRIKNMNEVSKPQRLVAKTGDTKGRDLYVQLVDDKDNGVNTADARLTLAYKTPSGIVNEIAFTPVNAEEGLYGLTYDAGLTHEAGVVTATIRLKTYDTTTETPNFEIYVEGSPLEGIHFTEVDGLTFKKVMDKVDSIDFRANLIEEDILKIDEQLQDMNTRIVYVEEDDSIDERVYNNENDIQLLYQEVERIDTELADLRLEVDNIEVVEGGGGGGTGEQDTGWRVYLDEDYQDNNFIYELYVRRVGNVVEIQGWVESKNTGINNNYGSSIHLRNRPRLSELFWGNGRRKYGGIITFYRGTAGMEAEAGMLSIGNGIMRVEMKGGLSGQVSVRYLTDRPFTDEYMDLPLADFN